MLVVTVELWPKGRGEYRKEIAKAHIVNDGTGNATRGNYVITLFDKRGAKWKVGKLTGFKRKRWLAMDLLMLALVALLGNRHTKDKLPPDEHDEEVDGA